MRTLKDTVVKAVVVPDRQRARSRQPTTQVRFPLGRRSLLRHHGVVSLEVLARTLTQRRRLRQGSCSCTQGVETRLKSSGGVGKVENQPSQSTVGASGLLGNTSDTSVLSPHRSVCLGRSSTREGNKQQQRKTIGGTAGPGRSDGPGASCSAIAPWHRIRICWLPVVTDLLCSRQTVPNAKNRSQLSMVIFVVGRSKIGVDDLTNAYSVRRYSLESRRSGAGFDIERKMTMTTRVTR
jgi:hypothetical protein